MKVWVISDTHNEHDKLLVPKGIDLVIHAGDAANHKSREINSNEMLNFVQWFESLPIKYKIFTGGNHDTSLESYWRKDDFAKRGIILLINETITIEGIKIFGSPYSPTFNVGWAFNCHRGKIGKHWSHIPLDADIVVTHTPAKYLLDTTDNGPQGCGALRSMLYKVNPKFHICGHIHDMGGHSATNQYLDTVFVNAAVVNNQHTVINNGHIIEI